MEQVDAGRVVARLGRQGVVAPDALVDPAARGLEQDLPLNDVGRVVLDVHQLKHGSFSSLAPGTTSPSRRAAG